MTTHDSSQISSELTLAGRRIAILASVLGSFLTPFMIAAVNVALPAIGRELGLDAVLLNWVPIASLVAFSFFLLPCGWLADPINARLSDLGILASLARGPGQPPRAAPRTVAAPPTAETAGPRAAPVLPPAGNVPASSLLSGDDHG